jgi:Icc protein
MTVSIAHLSDPHLLTGVLGGTAATGLSHALGRVLALDPRPDCVVLTGDLVDHGRADEYAVLHEVIDRFPLPLYLVAGNHDDSRALLNSFGGTKFLGGGNDTNYVVDHPAFTVVVLDSAVPGSPGGHLGPGRLAWLDDVLARRPELPAVVCVHHPPIPVGIGYLDGMRLGDGDALAAVISRHPRVVRVLAGHIHRSVVSAFAGSVLAVAPSTVIQSGLALNGGVPNHFPEPTSFLLHVMVEDSWVTHTVPISHATAPIGSF